MLHLLRILMHISKGRVVVRGVLFVSLFVTAQQGYAQCTLTLSGVIYDEDTRKGLEKATIEMVETGQKVLSNEKGNYFFKGLCPGNYTVKVSHVACATISKHLHIQQDLSYSFNLPHTSNTLQEVTVVGTSDSKSGAVGASLKGTALEATRGQSLGEALQKISGVTVLQTGTNIYKPVIHGLHSNRVIMLNNGIRQEGQQWGSEHAPEIDPFIANRLTVIKGASTLRYGADAIGGVVLVEPKLLRNQPGIGGDIVAGFFSNNRQAYTSAMIEGNSSKHPAFSWRAQGTYKRGGNAKTPDYWLANSGMEELNFSATAALKKTNKGIEIFYSQFNTKLGIYLGSHIGNVTDLMNVINSGQPPAYLIDAPFSYTIDRPYQQITHHLAKAKGFLNTGDIGRLNVVVSGQYNRRQEYDLKRFASSADRPQMDIALTTVGSDVWWDHFKGKKWRGTIGVNGSYQLNSYTERFFIPNYQAINAGAFIIEKWSMGALIIEGGIRYDIRNMYNIDKNNGTSFDEKFYGNLSANTGVNYKFSPTVFGAVNFSTAWRAPQINELFSDGLHHGAARIEKGNPNLNAERANSVLASLNIQQPKWQAEVVFYHKEITDFIYLKPVYPPQLTIRGAFPSFAYEQTDARLNGLDVNASFDITKHLSWQGKASILRAFDKEADDWIIQMPADRFENALSYQFANKGNIEDAFVKVMMTSVLRQTRVPEEGEIEITKPDGSTSMESDYAPPPGPYNLFGIETGMTYKMWKRPVKWMITGTNLFNITYRDYMNAFRYYADEMGINVAIKIQVPIGKI